MRKEMQRRKIDITAEDAEEAEEINNSVRKRIT
jgi:hypothetical protein